MLAEKLLAAAKPGPVEACTFPSCVFQSVFQILSVVSPVKGQGRIICHYQLGSAKRLGWQGAVRLQEVGRPDSELQGPGNVKCARGVGGTPNLRPKGTGVILRLTRCSCQATTTTAPPSGVMGGQPGRFFKRSSAVPPVVELLLGATHHADCLIQKPKEISTASITCLFFKPETASHKDTGIAPSHTNGQSHQFILCVLRPYHVPGTRSRTRVQMWR